MEWLLSNRLNLGNPLQQANTASGPGHCKALHTGSVAVGASVGGAKSGRTKEASPGFVPDPAARFRKRALVRCLQRGDQACDARDKAWVALRNREPFASNSAGADSRQVLARISVPLPSGGRAWRPARLQRPHAASSRADGWSVALTGHLPFECRRCRVTTVPPPSAAGRRSSTPCSGFGPEEAPHRWDAGRVLGYQASPRNGGEQR
jgi:hypothetical protein